MTLRDEYDIGGVPGGDLSGDAYDAVLDTEPIEAVYETWYAAYAQDTFDTGGCDIDGLYDHAAAIVAGRDDIRPAIRDCPRYMDGHRVDGLFLSALINAAPASQITLTTVPDALPPRHGTGKIGYVGYRNTKEVTIKDDAGPCTGFHMEHGSITVQGDAGRMTGGWMDGGALRVTGDVGARAGEGMDGGLLAIDGDTHVDIGGDMTGGEIRVHGSIPDRSGFTGIGGRITQQQGDELVHIWPEETP